MENDHPPAPTVLPPDKDTSLILASSPRAGGNCDIAAQIFAESLSARQIPHRIAWLREWQTFPCIACGACDGQKNPDLLDEISSPNPQKPLWRCPQSLKDDSRALLSALASAKSLCIVAPIFFYHLPAQLKALLDRLQPFWNQPGSPEANLPRRFCKIILIAGRPRGEQLFTGSLHTLRLSLGGPGFNLEEPLLLRGFDAPGSLRGNADAISQIAKYAAE